MHPETSLVVLLMMLPSITVTAQGVISDKAYNIPSGELVTVPSGNSAILVDEFAMGDDSQLVISGDTRHFAIRARAVTVGNRAVIVGRGHDGPEASAPGDHGEPGVAGPTIVLIFEQPDIQGLSVTALGGAGGKGGKGKQGRWGRNAECLGSGATAGGPGGLGGDGGAGGNGGSIFVILPTGAEAHGIELNVDSGEPGAPGAGGDGGPGGRGIDCGLWRRGGEPTGPRGREGSLGARGQPGTFGWRYVEEFTPAVVAEALREIAASTEQGGDSKAAKALSAFVDKEVLATP